MNRNSRILGLICARGGSKGLPGKNIKILSGKPLIAWSIKRALDLKISLFKLVVSTDDINIAEIGKKFGAEVPFLRPQNIANEKASKFSVWKHALNFVEEKENVRFDYFLDMDCTNPLLSKNDLEDFISSFFDKKKKKNFDGMITVRDSIRNPYFNQVEKNDEGYIERSKSLEKRVLRRQDAPIVYDVVAGFYIFDADFIRKNNNIHDGNICEFKVSTEKSFDIDNQFDFELVKYLFDKNYVS